MLSEQCEADGARMCTVVFRGDFYTVQLVTMWVAVDNVGRTIQSCASSQRKLVGVSRRSLTR